MSVELDNSFGQIHVSQEVIATLAGSAAMDCYGLVGMASRRTLTDGIAELLGRENMSKGVEVKKVDNQIHIDLHVIVGYGTKISEVARNVQEKVKYTLDQMLGLKVEQVNVHVQGVRNI